jgi:uncharacterized iron-regulated protein
MTIKYALMLALIVCCTACGMFEPDDQRSFQLPVPKSITGTEPNVFDLRNPQVLNELTNQVGEKRAIFIGEVHDHLEHHQNQLRIIQSLYAQNPDLAIGVEYLQQPFQRYLDDYIAGRIDEKEMLIKTEYFKRWQVDFRLLQPIFEFAREKHIPLLALNVADEVHNKVFKGGMKSLSPEERAQTPDDIEPASAHYRPRLKAIFDSHPQGDNFENFVDGVVLWDSAMADTASRYLITHPHSRIVVLAGLVHVMYGDGIPERVNHRLGGNPSAIMLNGSDFKGYPGIADYLLATQGNTELPKTGKLGILIGDGADSVIVNEFTAGSAAQAANVKIGDHILALDGIKVANMSEVKAIMFDKQPGDKVQVTVRRAAQQEMKFDVTLR